MPTTVHESESQRLLDRLIREVHRIEDERKEEKSHQRRVGRLVDNTLNRLREAMRSDWKDPAEREVYQEAANRLAESSDSSEADKEVFGVIARRLDDSVP